MADNVTLPGTGAVVAADDVGGVLFQQMKLAYGADGAATTVEDTAPLPVVLAGGIAGATLTQVPASATSVQLLPANAGRRGAVIVNDGTAALYLAYAATTSSTAYTYRLPPQAIFEMPLPIYTGVISGIWSAANGQAAITELH